MKSRLVLLVILWVVFGSVSLTLRDEVPLAAADVQENALGVPNESEIAEALESAPLMFIENMGQFEEGARFQVRGAQGSLWLAEDALWTTVVEPAPEAELDTRPAHETPAELESASSRHGTNIRLSFVGANPEPQIVPFDRLETTVSYFLGNDPEGWRPDVPVWGGVRYVDIYPGIDLEITGEGGQLQSQLVTRAGAVTDLVQLRVEGAALQGIEGNVLRLASDAGSVSFPLPAAEFELPIEGRGVDGKTARLLVQQAVLQELRAPVLSITQTSNRSDLIYSTYLGASWTDWGYGIAVDQFGNAHVTGYTESSDFPTTPGAFDTSPSYSRDVFVTKLNASGSALLYSTFLGGDDHDYGYAIALDGAGNAYLTGDTRSGDFPTTAGAYDPSHNGGNFDAFVTKLNASGSALLYSTFLGGGWDDSGRDLALDGAGNVYLTGDTRSGDFPTTPGAFDTSHNGGLWDVFVTKLNASGSDLNYSTFLGGGGDDLSYSLALDSAGSAYVTGNTQSNNFPITAGAFDITYNGNGDVFVTKLNSNGSYLVYSTFLGGESSDYGRGIALDDNANAYLTGITAIGFPTTPDAFDTSYNGGSDAFVTQLNDSGSDLNYSTFVGGAYIDRGLDIAVDGVGTAYITGETSSLDFPTTQDAFDVNYNGNSDPFATKLNASGGDIIYSTYLGGGGGEKGEAVVLDEDGSAYLTGITSSSDFPTTPGVFDPDYDNQSDAFVTKLVLEGAPPEKVAVLVHGWQGLNKDPNAYRCEQGVWGPYTYPGSSPEFGTIADALIDEGYTVYLARWTTSLWHTMTAEDAADCLTAQIQHIKNSTGQSSVTLVAHSMGGLVSRAYMEPWLATPPGDVDQLITFGTPHVGINIELLLKLLAHLNPTVDTGVDFFCELNPGTCQLSTEEMLLFNLFHRPSGQITYDFVGGDGGGKWWTFTHLIEVTEGPHDGLIGRRSATGLERVTGWTVVPANRWRTAGKHHDLFGSPTYFELGPDADSASCIYQFIPGGNSGSCDWFEGEPVEAPEAEGESAPSFAPTIGGTLASGETVTHPIILEGDEAQVLLSWTRGDLDLTLRTPDGTLITPGNVNQLPGGQYEEETGTGWVPMAAYGMAPPAAGEWDAIITATDVVTTTEYALLGAMLSPISMEVEATSSVASGASFTLTAHLDNNGAPISAASVQATLYGPAGPVTVSLTPGSPSIYTGQLIAPVQASTYQITVQATGSSPTSFAREHDLLLTVRPNDVQQSGTPSEQALDTNANGLYDILRVTVPLTVNRAAPYVTQAMLYAPDGTPIAEARVAATWSTGPRTLTLDFEGTTIGAAGLDGPYTVDLIIVSADEGQLVLDARPLLQTAPYQAQQFEGGALPGGLYLPIISR